MRTLALARKEFLHVLRDRRALAVMFLMPIVQLLLLGYAATTDIRHLHTAVYDADRTSASRALIEAYAASGYFDISHQAASLADMAALVDRGSVRAGLVILAGYGERLARGERAVVAFIIDGSDPSVANTVFAASQAVG